MSFWIDVVAETDDERVAAWQRESPAAVAGLLELYADRFTGDYSIGSLLALEALILDELPTAERMKHPSALPFIKPVIGYLGEVLRRAADGRWVWGQGTFAGMPCVAFDDDLGLPDFSPLLLLIRAVRRRDGRQFAALGSRLDAALAQHRRADSLDLLRALVIETLEPRGYSGAVASDHIVISGNGVSDWELSLENLRRKTMDVPRDQWPAIVGDHLGSMFAHFSASEEMPLDRTDFAQMRALVRTRMYPADMQDHGIPLVARMLAPGLAQRAVIDEVNTVMQITGEMLSAWPIEEDELFELAEANTRADGLLDVEEFDPDEAEQIYALFGNGDYASAHIRWLPEYPVVGQWGTAFVVPNEGMIYAHPLNGSIVFQALGTLARLALAGYDNRPSPISQSVYWYHDGTIEVAVTVVMADGELQLHVEPEFQPVMEAIAAAEAE